MMTHGEMRRMREAGFTYQAIADKSGISYGTVRSRLQAWGVEPAPVIRDGRPRKSKNVYPRWLIEELYWSCELSTKEIAYELDIPGSSVDSMMRRMRIPIRTRKQAWEVMKRRGTMATPRSIGTARAQELARLSAQVRQERVAI